MKLIKKITTEEEIEVSLPAYFKSENEFVRVYIKDESTRADKFSPEGDFITGCVDYPVSCYDRFYKVENMITEQEFLESLDAYYQNAKKLAEKIKSEVRGEGIK